MAGLQFGENKCFWIRFEWVHRGFLSERKGKVVPRRWTENRKGARTNSGESGASNLEAESIRSGAESLFGKVQEGVVNCEDRDKAQQCPWYIYGRECLSCTEFFVGLLASVEIETKMWCGQFCVFSAWGEQHSSVCDDGFGQRKQAGQKGENCSSQGMTEWVGWPVPL